TVELGLEVENRQRVHSVVTPMLAPLVEASGVTWFPAAAPEPASLLLPPGEVRALAIELPLPAELPPGTYRGALILQGFRDGGVRGRPASQKRGGRGGRGRGGRRAPGRAGGRREPARRRAGPPGRRRRGGGSEHRHAPRLSRGPIGHAAPRVRVRRGGLAGGR